MPVKPRAPRVGRGERERTPRPAQRRRTRKAIVDATMALLARGDTPSAVSVAAAPDVSRRTVYLYFPSFDQLLIDATLGLLSQASIDRAIEAHNSGAQELTRFPDRGTSQSSKNPWA